MSEHPLLYPGELVATMSEDGIVTAWVVSKDGYLEQHARAQTIHGGQSADGERQTTFQAIRKD